MCLTIYGRIDFCVDYIVSLDKFIYVFYKITYSIKFPSEICMFYDGYLAIIRTYCLFFILIMILQNM